MSSTRAHDVVAPAIQLLTDRYALTRLIDRYMASHDEDGPAAAIAELFTKDARLEAAYADSIIGGSAIEQFQRTIMGKFTRRQHTSSGCLVEIDRDEATFRVNMLVHQVHHETTAHTLGLEPGAFLAGGGYLEGSATRTTEGWRLSRVKYTGIWREGALPQGVEDHK